MRFFLYLTALLLSANAVAVQDEETCFPLFIKAGAIPKSKECVFKASAANVNLSNYFCTASGNHVQRYCQADCPIDPLTPITDPDAIEFENGKTLNTQKMQPVALASFSCISTEVKSMGASFTMNSGWRPAAYQDHLYEIHKKINLLLNISKFYDGCLPTLNAVSEERKKHGLKDRVGKTSKHTAGTAFDAVWSRNISNDQIDSIAEMCGVYRPFRANDPVHFQVK